jgi:hypothetical protein
MAQSVAAMTSASLKSAVVASTRMASGATPRFAGLVLWMMPAAPILWSKVALSASGRHGRRRSGGRFGLAADPPDIDHADPSTPAGDSPGAEDGDLDHRRGHGGARPAEPLEMDLAHLRGRRRGQDLGLPARRHDQAGIVGGVDDPLPGPAQLGDGRRAQGCHGGLDRRQVPAGAWQGGRGVQGVDDPDRRFGPLPQPGGELGLELGGGRNRGRYGRRRAGAQRSDHGGCGHDALQDRDGMDDGSSPRPWNMTVPAAKAAFATLSY